MLPAHKNALANALIYRALVLPAVRASFRAVHVRWPVRAAAPSPGGPLLLVSNHCSWWDAYMLMVLNERVLRRDGYAMAEDTQLARYPFFRLTGVFSISRSDGRSAARSLGYAASLLRGGRMVVIMPQGKILANDVRPLGFESGIGHLVRKAGACTVLPVALRYEFIGEQKPEAFISIAAPVTVSETDAAAIRPKEFAAECERILTAELDTLRADIAAYRFDSFAPLLRGAASINRLWDGVLGRRHIRQIGPR